MADALQTAVEFLLANGFSIDIQCKYGVPYLSREEEKQAIAKATERFTRQTTKRSLNIKESDHESLEFIQAVRQVVDSWLAEGEVRLLCSEAIAQLLTCS